MSRQSMNATMPAEASASKPKPRYRITEKCYLNDRLYDPETMGFEPSDDPDEEPQRKPLIVAFAGVPAHYMVPVNDEARAQAAKYPERMTFHDPVGEMARLDAMPTDPSALVGALASALANVTRQPPAA